MVNWSRVCLHIKYEQRETFYVLAAVLTNILVFRGVIPCRLTHLCRSSGAACYLRALIVFRFRCSSVQLLHEQVTDNFLFDILGDFCHFIVGPLIFQVGAGRDEAVRDGFVSLADPHTGVVLRYV